MTRVQVEPRSCDRGHRKNDAFTLSATLPTKETFCRESAALCVLRVTNKKMVIAPDTVSLQNKSIGIKHQSTK